MRKFVCFFSYYSAVSFLFFPHLKYYHRTSRRSHHHIDSQRLVFPHCKQSWHCRFHFYCFFGLLTKLHQLFNWPWRPRVNESHKPFFCHETRYIFVTPHRETFVMCEELWSYLYYLISFLKCWHETWNSVPSPLMHFNLQSEKYALRFYSSMWCPAFKYGYFNWN